MVKKWSLMILVCAITLNVSAQRHKIESLLDAVHLDTLVKYVRQYSGELPVEIHGTADFIRSRHYSQPGNEKAFQFMKAELQRLGYQIDSMVYRPTGKNLLGIKPGTLHPKQYVLLGAHYDNYPPGIIAPGADDNASGMAAVMEAARIFKDVSFPYTIVLGFWDEEEIGLVGSAAYVQSVGSDNDTLLGYINLDMIGWDGDDDGLVEVNTKNVANSVRLAELAEKCNVDYSIGLTLDVINPGSNASDFASFWSGGYTAIGINEVYYGEDNNPYWHTAGDSLGNFNLNYFLKCTKLALATVAELASGESEVVGVRDVIAHSSDIRVYPNTFVSELYVTLKNTEQKIHRIAVLDLNGKIHFEQRSMSASVDLSSLNLSKGLYLIQVETDVAVFTEKVVKL